MSNFTRVLPVHGTWGFPAKRGDWWQKDSALSWYFLRHGIGHLRPEDEFCWSGDAGGLRWPFGKNRSHTDWQAGGKALRWYLRDGRERRNYVRVAERRVISHSHGLAPVLYACAEGLWLDRLVSVTAPIRADMAEIARRARPNIGTWVHVHTDADKMQIFGAMLDGVVGIHRKAEWKHADGNITRADEQIKIPGVGHSGLLNNSEKFYWWEDAGLIPFLKEPTPCHTLTTPTLST